MYNTHILCGSVAKNSVHISSEKQLQCSATCHTRSTILYWNKRFYRLVMKCIID